MTLVARLERPLPARLPVAGATALFCTGICFDTEQPITELWITVDGVAHVASAFAMPRPDLTATDGGPSGPELRLRSGFWGTVPVPPQAQPTTISLEATARLADGSHQRVELGRVEVTERGDRPAPLQPRPARPEGPLITVCMATYEPEPRLLAAQLQSLREQTDQRWVCVISDDCTSAEGHAQILNAIGDDLRFAVSRSERRLGFYRNFERALGLAPAQTELVALCDQDDRWHPDKLAVLRDALGSATLVYCDQRLVDSDGVLLRETMWQGRRNNHTDLASMLVANTITGAATLFTRELMELALPFPDSPGFQFHDHWLAVTALAAGDVAYVDRPLYDYVQHAGAVFGDVTHGSRPAPRSVPGDRLGRLGRLGRLCPLGPLGRLGALKGPWPRTSWRAAYFYGYLAREVQAQVLLTRLGDRLTAPKRRVLERFVACDRRPGALAWLAARALRSLAGATETLGSELELAEGVLWKMLVAAQARRPDASGAAAGRGGLLRDASIPPPQAFSQRRLRRWRSRL